jgi:hypothetical protein
VEEEENEGDFDNMTTERQNMNGDQQSRSNEDYDDENAADIEDADTIDPEKQQQDSQSQCGEGSQFNIRRHKKHKKKLNNPAKFKEDGIIETKSPLQ